MSGPDATAEPSGTQATAPPRRPGWRSPRWIGAPLGALLSTLVLCLILLVGTQTGLRIALSVAEELAPDVLQVAAVDGRLAGRLHLVGLRLRLEGIEVRLSELDLDWRPLGVFAGRLRVDHLAAAQLDIVLAPGDGKDKEGPSRPFQLPELVLPVDLEIVTARLERLTLLQADETGETPQLRIDDIALAGGWQGSRVELRELAARLPEPGLWARAKGWAELGAGHPLELSLSWGLAEEIGIPLSGTGRLEGRLAGGLVLTHDLSGAAEMGLRAGLTQVLEAPRWSAELDIIRVDLPALRSDLPRLDLQGQLTSEGSLADARLAATLAATAPARPKLGVWRVILDLAWRDPELIIETLALTEDRSQARIQADARITPATAPIEIALTGAWQGLRWPLAGEPSLRSAQGTIDVSGTLDALRYQIVTEADGAAVPSLALDLVGMAAPTGTRIETLEVATLAGQVTGRGELGWDSGLSWDAELRARDLNPGVQWSQWPGRLGGQISSTGRLSDGARQLLVRIAEMEGTLRDNPVAASGRLVGEGEALRLEDLVVSSGPSRLQASGAIGTELALDLNFSSPDLGSLWPDARGRLDMVGQVEGPPASPRAALTIDAADVAWGNDGLASLSGEVELGLDSAAPLILKLSGRSLTVGGLAWDALRLQGDGTTGEHRLTMALSGQPLALELTASGGLTDGSDYRGQLGQLELTDTPFGDWSLSQPSPIEIAPPRLAVGPLCLTDQTGGGGCIELAQAATGDARIELDLGRLNLAYLAPWLPEGLTATGAAEAEAQLAIADDRLRGTARLGLPQGRFLWNGSDVPSLDLSGARLALTADGRDVAAELAIPLTGHGALDASLRLADWRLSAPAHPGQRLSGGLKAEITGLDRLAPRLLPDLNAVTGRLTADLTLAGTVGEPDIQGFIRLAEGGLKLPLIGLAARDIDLAATASPGGRIDYLGTAQIGPGRLDLNGTTRRQGTAWDTRLRLAGKRLRVADTSEYRILISPDITAALGPDGIQVVGEVRMPEAMIQPRTLPAGTLTPSPDVVTETQPDRPPVPLDLDLSLILGQDVSIDAFGVRGDLTGSLHLLQSPEQEMPLGDGQLQIVDGTYRLSAGFGLLATIGQPLKIEQGRLIFANTPLANPGLLLQAQRESGDLTAGVQVLGTLREPKLSFFSETDPGMTQAEITNYLITGNPPRGAADAESRSLAVGTYVAPKLYTEYVTSIGEEPDKVRLRYELRDNIEIQTETGEQQGADIFFKFER